MRKTKGFTLIELLIVIALISILSVGLIAIVNPAEQIKKGNDAKRKSDLSQIQKALEQYYQDNGTYPTSTALYYMETSDATDRIKEWGDPWPPYMNQLPQDKGNRKYLYYSTNGQDYYLYASLERGSKDPQACNGGAACPKLGTAGFPFATACINTCNYGVSSPNVSP